MKISMICTGRTGEKLKKRLERRKCSFFHKEQVHSRFYKGSKGNGRENSFETADSIIFIGAAGIAVRSIAPLYRAKRKDPAVLVTNECGKFDIPVIWTSWRGK